MGSMSIWHWVIVALVVMLLFGKGRLSDMMGDLAKGIKSFKAGMAEDVTPTSQTYTPPPAPPLQVTQAPPAHMPPQTNMPPPAYAPPPVHPAAPPVAATPEPMATVPPPQDPTHR